MAWSIEEFSGPILKKAEAANKKREKDVKRQQYALMGVTVANQALRHRAQQRANELERRGSPILQQASQHFEDGLEFWKNHNDMLGTDFNPNQWEDAWRKQTLDGILAGQGLTNSNVNRQMAMENLKPHIEDELNAYREQMELMSEFRGGTTSTVRDDMRGRYYGDIEEVLTTLKNRTVENSSIFSSLMGALGMGKTTSLEGIDFTGGPIEIPENATAEEERLITFFNQVKRDRQEYAEQSEDATYRVDQYNIADYRKQEDFDWYSDPNILGITGDLIDLKYEDLELKLRQLGVAYEFQDSNGGVVQMRLERILANPYFAKGARGLSQEPNPNNIGGMSDRAAFANDLSKLASAFKTRSIAANPNLSVPHDSVFWQASLDTLANTGLLEMSDEGMAYTNLSPQNLLELSMGGERYINQNTLEQSGLANSPATEGMAVELERMEGEQRRSREAGNIPSGDGPSSFPQLIESISDGATAGVSPETLQGLVDIFDTDVGMSEDQKSIVQNILGDQVPPPDSEIIEPEEEKITNTWGLTEEQQEQFSEVWNQEILPRWGRIKEAVSEYDSPVELVRGEPKERENLTAVVNPLNERIRDSVLSFWDRLPRFQAAYGPNERSVKLERFVVGLANAAANRDHWDVTDEEWDSLEAKAKERDDTATEEERLVDEENLRRREPIDEYQREYADRARQELSRQQVPSLLDPDPVNLDRFNEFKETADQSFRQGWENLLDAPLTPNSMQTLRDLFGDMRDVIYRRPSRDRT